MALLDDIGGSAQQAAPPQSSLLSDIGGNDDTQTEASAAVHPVTDEVIEGAKNMGREAIAGTIKGVGALADLPGNIWDMAFHPDDDEPHPMAHLVAEKLADRLQKNVPSLKPKNEGPVARSVGAGFEALPSAILGGPEGAADALLPTFASGASSQVAKEAGGGPVAQFAAGLSPLAPAGVAAGVRGLIRGGEEGAATTAENLKNAQDAGIKLSAGQASDNAALRAGETAGGKLPGGGSIAETRGAGLNSQVEESVANITKKLAPDHVLNPPTPTAAGETIQAGVKKKVQALNDETSEAKEAMNKSVGGKDTPFAAPKLEETLKKVTGGTGVEQIDNLVTGAKTKAVAKAVDSIANQPKTPTSYNADGEGAHFVSSPNGETHAVEQSNGDLKVTRSDTSEAAQGKGEGTARLDTLAHVATAKGKNLVSDVSVSPAEAAAYEKLSRKGWTVEKNPNSEVNPDTGNTISDSPKNPVYTVKAPKTTTTPGTTTVGSTSSEGHFGGDWSYNPATGKSEPVIAQPVKPEGTPSQTTAELNPETPHTFDSLRELRTLIGRGIRGTRDPGQQGQLKQLYGAISDDLEEGVKNISPEAHQSYSLFNNVAKQNADTQKTLVRAVSKLGGPEQVFKTAMAGSKDGATKIAPIMNTLDEEGQNLMRATVLHRMGRAGGSADAPFDANTFLTNWKAMSPEAKNVMFNAKGTAEPGQLRASLDSLGKTLDLLKSQGYIKSGFVKGIQQGTAALVHGGMAGVMALLAERAGSAGMHMLSGNPLGAAAAIGGAVGTLAINPVMSRVLTNPKTAAWLAQATQAPKGMVPVLINQLNQLGEKDPDAKDLSTLISQAGSGGGSAPSGVPTQSTVDPNKQGTPDEDQAISNNHKMVRMKGQSGAAYYGVDPSTFKGS